MIKILDFYADWCGPCKTMEPTIKELASKYDVEKIDVDAEPRIAEQYKVLSIPTLIILKDGEEAKRLLGIKSFKEIKKEISGL